MVCGKSVTVPEAERILQKFEMALRFESVKAKVPHQTVLKLDFHSK